VKSKDNDVPKAKIEEVMTLYFSRKKIDSVTNPYELLETLLAKPSPDICFANWVQKPLQEAFLKSNSYIGLAEKWLQTNNPDAQKAWNFLFKKFCSLPSTHKYVLDRYNETLLLRNHEALINKGLTNDELKHRITQLKEQPISQKELFEGQAQYFFDYINTLSVKADTPVHQSIKLPKKQKQQKIQQLKKTFKKAQQLCKELSLDQNSLIFHNYPQHIQKAVRSLIIESESNQDLEFLIKQILITLDISITDILTDQISKLDQLNKTDSLPSPNSESARLNHFVRNWIIGMYVTFDMPMWETSATVTSIFFDGEPCTAEQIRDSCRKAKKGTFLPELKKMIKREKLG
jgi:hypothetical protein